MQHLSKTNRPKSQNIDAQNSKNNEQHIQKEIPSTEAKRVYKNKCITE